MPKLLWRKVLRDLWLNKPRTLLTVLVIAIGIFAMGGVLSAFGILSREIGVNYMGTTPASATLEVEGLTDAMLQQVRAQPEIAYAEARESIAARIKVGNDAWQRLTLYVIPDFDHMQLATFKPEFRPEQGAWPPREGEMLVERASLQVGQAKLGDAVTVKMPSGVETKIKITGLVHDPSQAPGWMDAVVYGYITPNTLALLDAQAKLGELKIGVAQQSLDEAHVRVTAQHLASQLEAQGAHVSRIEVPPPGNHPHQTQMNALLFLLSVFGFLTLVLGSILTANMVAALLAQQMRQIGMLKAIGTRSPQVMAMYAGVVFVLSVAALGLALPLGLMAGRAGATAIANILNFTVTSYAVPHWVFVAQIVAGLFVPLVFALWPIYRGSKTTVCQALSDYGVSQSALSNDALDKLLASIRGISRLLLLSLRNTFRRRARLVLTLAVLGMGGALFMASLNLNDAWRASLAAANEARHYDIDIRLQTPANATQLQAQLASIPGVTKVEAWGFAPAALSRPNQIAVVRTYPDGAHGGFSVLAPPANTTLVQFDIQQGRWLQPDDTNAVVLNHSVLTNDPTIKLGDRLSLRINGRLSEWRVVGIVREFVSPATAYVPMVAFQQAAGQPDQARTFRIVTQQHDAASQKAIAKQVERVLAEAKLSATYVMPTTDYAQVASDHVVVLTVTLLIVAALMVLVGVLGLTSTMSLNVLERTREFGVLQAIGARPRVVRQTVVAEGLVIAVLSWGLGVLISLPLSALIGIVVGRVGFGAPLLFAISPLAALGWLVLVCALAALASDAPARSASRLTVREILAYE
jgi:putative ABC transport system permease protein